VKLKTLPPAIWLLLLLTLNGFAQTPPESPGGQSGGYGIEPSRSYPGTLVLELMEAAEAEIDAAVEEAYAEGYKAASLRFVPELAARNEEIVLLNMTIAGEKKKRWRIAAAAFGLSLLGGMAAGAIMAGR
jgi:hypothetical protein